MRSERERRAQLRGFLLGSPCSRLNALNVAVETLSVGDPSARRRKLDSLVTLPFDFAPCLCGSHDNDVTRPAGCLSALRGPKKPKKNPEA